MQNTMGELRHMTGEAKYTQHHITPTIPANSVCEHREVRRKPVFLPTCQILTILFKMAISSQEGYPKKPTR